MKIKIKSLVSNLDNIIKLMSALENPILERYSKSSLNPIIIDGEEE